MQNFYFEHSINEIEMTTKLNKICHTGKRDITERNKNVHCNAWILSRCEMNWSPYAMGEFPTRNLYDRMSISFNMIMFLQSNVSVLPVYVIILFTNPQQCFALSSTPCVSSIACASITYKIQWNFHCRVAKENNVHWK